MADPELQGGENILIRTQGVYVKSIAFEAILTNRRIILVDRLKNLLPPKEIPLGTIRTVESGENANRDFIITLGVITKSSSGGARQMVLAFSREGGGNRLRERDEWVSQIKAYLTPSFDQVINKVMPEIENQLSGKMPPETGIRPSASSIEVAQPAKKVVVKTPIYAPDSAPESVLGTYCTKCGTKLPEGSLFCTKCGTQITPPEKARDAFPEPRATVPESINKAPPEANTPPPAEIIAEWNDEESVQGAIQVPEKAHFKQATLRQAISQDSQRTNSFSGMEPETKQLKPRLFSPRDLPHTPLAPSSNSSPKRGSNKRKITLIAGIIVIIVIAAVVVTVLPKMGLGSHGSSASTSAIPTNTVSVTATPTASASGTLAVIPTRAPVTIPTTGVYVSVSYIGGFNGSYSTGGVTSNVTPNSGNQLYQVVNATGSVKAVFQKTDETTTHALTVWIYENGKQLAANSTSSAYGKVIATASL